VAAGLGECGGRAGRREPRGLRVRMAGLAREQVVRATGVSVWGSTSSPGEAMMTLRMQ
jgi:hypothetical protein